MSRSRKMHLVALFVGLVLFGGLMAVWWPVSAGIGAEITAAYHQYLPIIHSPDCVPPPLIPPDDLERDLAVEDLINEIRDEYGLPRFANSQKITQAALRHSNDMADNNFFDHTGSDGSRAGDRLDEACYNWQSYGEIIAAGFRTPAGVVEAWMNSEEGHPEIILDGALEDFGAGYAYNRSSEYKHYWTVDFGLLANEHLATSANFHTCSFHVVDDDGEIWLNLYSIKPCAQAFGESPDMNSRR